MTLALVAAGAFAATMLGGVLALRLRDRLHLILGFSAGAVVAVAFFDLLPESFELGAATHDAFTVSGFVALGFLLYLLLDRVLLLHGHSHDGENGAAHDDILPRVEPRGHVRAGSFSVHSFLDGVGIGLAFQVSAPVGFVVAAAVLAHDFSDGINTVNVVMRHGGRYAQAMRWLVVDALAPVAGIAVTALVSVTESSLGLLLAVFTGFFLYIGASDLIPESHHAHPTFWTTFMTLMGALALFIAIRLAA